MAVDFIEFEVYCLLYQLHVQLWSVLAVLQELNILVPQHLVLMVVMEEHRHSTIPHVELQVAKVVSASKQTR